VAISVAVAGIIIGHIFLLEGGFFLNVFAAIAPCGTLGWVTITRDNRAKDDGAKASTREILGKPRIVVRECSPEGKVRIGDITWSAISYDGVPLRVGAKVTVQDMQEMKLAVIANPSTMCLHH